MSITRKLAIAYGVLALAGTAHGSEFEFHPAIAVSEEYNDNIFDTRDNRVTDFITHAIPNVNLAYKGPVMTANINYTLDFMYYAKGKQGTDFNNNLEANAHLKNSSDRYFLDVSDVYQRVSLDVTRDVSKDSPSANQSNQNIVNVSPYLVIHPTQLLMVKTGYRFINTLYFASPGINKTNNGAFLESSYEVTSQWSATFGYDFNHEDSDVSIYDLNQVNVGFRYEYVNKSSLFGQAGYTWINYNNGSQLNNLFWSAGLSHNFDTSTATLTTGVRYDEDPLANITMEQYVIGSFDQQLDNGAVGLSLYYSEFNQADTDILQTRKYGGVLRGNYRLTSDISCNAAFTAEKYDEPLQDSYTRHFLVETGISRTFAHDLTVSLNYIFSDYYSPGIYADNKNVNRITIQVRKVF